ncbi:MAG: hypothetical protein GTO14_01255, partial [Anaerolineales bacterium]|nr:hypothetical protein [Anaerolineales bacterium]
MRDKKFIPLAFCLLVLLALACDAPFGLWAPPEPTEFGAPRTALSASRTPSPTARIPPSPTFTSSPTSVPTATFTTTLTPAPPWVTPKEGDILCYFGPSKDYSVDGGLLAGENVPVLGRDEVALWLQIENPRRPGKHCWVISDDVSLEGEAMLAPVLPPPVSIVTAVTVDLKPKTIKPSPCVFPVTFDVDITIQVTGPTTVTIKRVQSTGLSAPSESIVFTAAGTWSGGDYLRV